MSKSVKHSGGGSGVQCSPQGAVGAPYVWGWGGREGAITEEVLGSVTSYFAECSLSGKWQVSPWHSPAWAPKQYLGFGEPMWGSLASSASAPA